MATRRQEGRISAPYRIPIVAIHHTWNDYLLYGLSYGDYTHRTHVHAHANVSDSTHVPPPRGYHAVAGYVGAWDSRTLFRSANEIATLETMTIILLSRCVCSTTHRAAATRQRNIEKAKRERVCSGIRAAHIAHHSRETQNTEGKEVVGGLSRCFQPPASACAWIRYDLLSETLWSARGQQTRRTRLQ
ncbi:hypothetical protein BV25DRAFT_1841840 [Artomyces pyxidatus]|uniref:Uncharacterized protein n=1 Tax=Artomyces pyxidatus TaxID=48021 RepID=A0ACB8SL93_9AGAM|nr:hypothetical protein BV25DRAFT_1841840 [Artomyces pyxidatus]